jgi:ABC-type branched-subunit amino acid transport system substrate-binding protein
MITVALLIGACSNGGTSPQAIDSPTATLAPGPSGGSLDPGKPAGGTKGNKPGSNVSVPGNDGGAGGNPTALPTVKPAKGFEPAHLYTAAEDSIGITDDKIVLCVHAALNLAPVFNISEKSLNVYWDYVNDELGGIYGRKVEITYTDDKYGAQPSDVRAAYEGCKARNPFILLGGIGFDQIPQVRAWAEEDHQLYIHHIARSDPSKKYSFSYLPTVETLGTRAAQWILDAHRGQSVGVIWRNSEHWEPGHKTFKAELAKHDVEPVADAPADKNASVYATQIRAMIDADAKVVFIWENALSAIEIIRQAADQNYTPQWVVFPFNLMTETLGDDTVNPIPVEGIATWDAYMPGTQDRATKAYQQGKLDGAFEPYKALVKEFERQHNRYASGENRDDIVFQTWVGWMQLHSLLLGCGPGCTRNRVVGLMQSGLHDPVEHGCSLNFADDHIGSNAVNVLRAFRNPDNGIYGWKEIQHCKTSF